MTRPATADLLSSTTKFMSETYGGPALEGHEDWKDGKPISANPYDEGADYDAWKQWRQGWRAAKDDQSLSPSRSTLEWTDEPPEDEGWYWIEVGRGAFPVRVDPYPFDDDSGIPEGELAIWVYLQGWVGSIDAHMGRWAGPIPRPSPNQDQ